MAMPSGTTIRATIAIRKSVPYSADWIPELDGMMRDGCEEMNSHESLEAPLLTTS